MADDLYWRIKEQAAGLIRSLSLPLVGRRVYGQLFPSESTGYDFMLKKVVDVVFPCVSLTGEGEEDELLPGESEGFVGVFPQRVWLLDTLSPDSHGKEADYLTIRKTVIGAFHQRRLFGVDEVRQCLVSPRVIFDQRLPQYQKVVSGMVIRFEWAQARYPNG